MTFIALSPSHKFAKYVPAENRQKEGIFTTRHAVHPITSKRIPIWIADYVLEGYGKGAVMGVPAHDERDYDFAMKYGIDIQQVIACQPLCGDKKESECLPHMGEGALINSGIFTGRSSSQAFGEIISWLEDRGLGRATCTYKLRDWCISRQRYWGPPIPIVYCDDCGTVPVPENDLPVELPYVEQFEPDGTGRSPLLRTASFNKTTCPTCGGKARRETDVSDNFLDSAWYFLRYPSTEVMRKAFSEARTKKWLPVDMYIGGNEHAVLHLMYTRFITMALHDAGYLDFEEPFKQFRAHGLIILGGAKMSKSRGNIVNPDDYLERYGADVTRTFLMFFGNYQEGGDFRDENLVGVVRFIHRVWALAKNHTFAEDEMNDQMLISSVHRKIQKISRDIEGLRYNTAVAALMELLQLLGGEPCLSKSNFSIFLRLLCPFAPFITHELWERLGFSGTLWEQPWPRASVNCIIDEEIDFVIQINGKLRDRFKAEAAISRQEAIESAITRERVQTHLRSVEIQKYIFVPGKLLNIVTG